MKLQLLLGFALLCITVLTGCLETTDVKSADHVLNSSITAKGVIAQSKLEQCVPEKEGAMVFEESTGTFFTCHSNVWVALNLKGEKGDRGEDGAPPPTPASPCLSVHDASLHYGDRIDGSDYSFNAVKALPGQRYCLDGGGNAWVDFQPSLKLMTSAPMEQIIFEENLCKSAFAKTIINDYYKKSGGGFFLQIKNANMGAKLKRAIICDPDMYGANLVFPLDY